MILRSIQLRQFRSYEEAMFGFADTINMVAGPNGAGKTNLLEAIYVCMRGVSFRVSDKELPCRDHNWFRLDAAFDTQTRAVRYQQTASPGKQLSINDGARKRFTRTQRLPVVLFEPDMLRTLSGSPARRRRLLDELVSQWYGDGAALLRRYERVLAQRNNVLKGAYELPTDVLEDRLFAWDVSFAELATRIEYYRGQVIVTLNESLSDMYSQIAGRSHRAAVQYTLDQTMDKQQVLQRLHQQRRLDIARGYTTVGPHRNDFSVTLDGQPIDSTASRGEQRSLVLAIKHIEAAELARVYESAPILLLDDLTGELDAARVNSLLTMTKSYQTIATTAHHDPLFAKAAQRLIALPLQ